MEKEFVPYELAWELKQLGFDEPCFGYYDPNKKFEYLNWETFKDFPYLAKNSEWQDLYGAPTYSQAFRWFREKHNIDAWVQPFVSEKQNGKPFLPDESYAYYIFEDGVYVADGVNFLDSEEAEMTCLKKLIDHCKN
jgi:hypothetical protein